LASTDAASLLYSGVMESGHEPLVEGPPASTELRFTKVERGWYATDDGRWMVVSDGYDPSQSIGASGDYEGYAGGEWALVQGGDREDHQTGVTLDWFPTMRQAIDRARVLDARTR
jgi:hypothetical protein